jgi:glycerol-3-phosphate acyltransferase PlsX
MSVVLDLGANIECSSKNLLDFSIMGCCTLHIFISKWRKAKCRFIKYRFRRTKGNETIKETYQKSK